MNGHQRGARGVLVAIIAVAMLGVAPSVASSEAPASTVQVDGAVIDAIERNGSADFWVDYDAAADLSGASSIADWAERGQFVFDRLTATADASQADLASELTKLKVDHQRFWAANTIFVHGGDQAALDSVRSTPGVSRVRAPQSFKVPVLTPASEIDSAINAVEWGIANTNADDVWSTFGARGEGVVVGSIDTGALFTHPAIVNQYRGNLGGGTFNHNYNWFDPAAVCGSPAPCDNNNHGTHTIGTMVGDDGAANQIGMAPNAEWISAKGCESNSCSDTSLLAAGQWMLAPTDLANANPNPALRPNIINNSWGEANGGAVDGWYRATLTAWTAAGIFGVFSNGNDGPGCNTTGSPADNLEAYGVGAYDINNTIASFSSKGPGESGSLRPSISAPGVAVRSSIANPANGYGSLNGTSMAAPHVAGAVALLWSAAPALVGDITQTRSILDSTAIDTSDLTCGGTAADNNVYGEGRLDVLAAANLAPTGPSGSVTGRVTDAQTTAPISGAQVRTVVNGSPRTTTSAANGKYTLANLPVGTYTVTASAFGHNSLDRSAIVTDGNTTSRSFPLAPLPTRVVTGAVSAGSRLAGVTVTIAGTTIPPVTTDANGVYTFPAVPDGTYTFVATYGNCASSLSKSKVVNGPETLNFALTRVTDTYGHKCDLVPSTWVAGTTLVPLTGDDVSAAVPLPFSFSFYGTSYATANVSSNGHLSFTAASTAYSNTAIPTASAPNAAIYPAWDDLHVDAGSGVYTRTLGSAPNRQFVIEWRNVRPFSAPEHWDFEVVLFENGQVYLRYRNVDAPRDQGNSATVGIENAAGNDALQYSLNQAVLSDDVAIRFRRTGAGPF